ncbi:MAG: hypothetical protein ACLFU0_01080 [Alphaproteobacteria bacterium]
MVLATVAMPVSGIVMAVFKGKAIDVFNLVVIPAPAKAPWLAGLAHDATFARMVGKGA